MHDHKVETRRAFLANVDLHVAGLLSRSHALHPALDGCSALHPAHLLRWQPNASSAALPSAAEPLKGSHSCMPPASRVAAQLFQRRRAPAVAAAAGASGAAAARVWSVAGPPYLPSGTWDGAGGLNRGLEQLDTLFWRKASFPAARPGPILEGRRPDLNPHRRRAVCQAALTAQSTPSSRSGVRREADMAGRALAGPRAYSPAWVQSTA